MAKKNENHNILGKVAAGAAVIGAGALAAKVLSNPDNREKIGNAMRDVGEKGKEVFENVKEKFEESLEKLRAEYDELVYNIEAKVKEGKNSKELKELQTNAKKLKKGFEDIKDEASDKGKEAFADLKSKVAELKENFEAA